MPGIRPEHLRQLIHNVTVLVDLHSPDATELILGTAAQESSLGFFLRQIDGPALGIFQIEPTTEQDIWKNYLAYRSKLKAKIIAISGVISPSPLQLEGNLIYQIIICRLIYKRTPAPLPSYHSIYEMADYWKEHFNTFRGRGRAEDFIRNYIELVMH